MANDTLFGLQVLFESAGLRAAAGDDLRNSWKAHIDAAAALGVDVIRFPGDWRGLQPTSSSEFNQWYLDGVTSTIKYANDLGIKVVMNFAQSPYWATNGTAPELSPEALWYPPLGANVTHYVASLLKLHETLGNAGLLDAVVGWEIWNEPNTTTYWKSGGLRPETDVQIELSEVQNYVTLLNASYDALKAADPSAVILGGSLAGCDFDYLAKMYQLGAKYDGLAVHPYPKANPFNDGLTYGPGAIDTRDPLALVWSFKPGIEALRAMMVANGEADVKMWFTEFGWSSENTWGAAGSPERQGAYTAEALRYVVDMDYVAAAITFRSYDVADNSFGMYTADGALKPAGLALREFMFNLNPKSYENIQPGLEADFAAQTAVFRHAARKAVVELKSLNAKLDGPTDLLHIVGSAFADSLTGTGTTNKVFGQWGSDKIYGRSGADMLDGGRGRDLLRGDRGADTLSGGAGADKFEYDRVIESNLAKHDTILDFAIGMDKIDLSTIDAVAGSGSNQRFTWIGSAEFSNVAGQLHQRADASGTVIEGDINGDGVADIKILLANAANLQATDFIL
jgi:hypothetical protein